MYAMKRGESHAGSLPDSRLASIGDIRLANEGDRRRQAGVLPPIRLHYDAVGKLPEALSASYTDRAQVRTLSQYRSAPLATTFAAVIVH